MEEVGGVCRCLIYENFGFGCRVQRAHRCDPLAKLRSGRPRCSEEVAGDELPQDRGELNKPGAAAALSGERKQQSERCETPGGLAVLRETSRFGRTQSPGAPLGSGTVGSISGRKGRRGLEWEATSKAAEEKTLEGRKPKKARVRCSPRFGGGWRPPSRSEPTSGVADGLPAGGPEERHERRGPERGTAGWEEQGLIGGTSRAPRRLTGRRQAHTGASRREGNQTLRAEGAGAWNPRDEPDRVCRGVS